MLYHPAIRKLSKITPNYQTSYLLSAVYLDAEARTAVSTDGHAMAIIDASNLIEDGETSFLIPVDALKAADSLFSKLGRTLSKRDRAGAQVYIRAGDGIVTVSSPLTKRAEIFELPAGQFPAWNKVIPQKAGDWKSVCLDAQLLLRLAEALDGQRKEMGLTLFVKAESDAIMVAATGAGVRQSFGVLMPRRDAVVFPAKFWTEKKPVADDAVPVTAQPEVR